MSKKIFLSNGNFTLVSDEDHIFLAGYSWYPDDNSNYIRGRINGKLQYMHRIIAKRMKLDLSNMIDHIDRNKLNNCRNNLRVATRQQNSANSRSRKNNKSGYKGICLNHDHWRAQIRVNRKTICLGTFNSPEEAHEAYCKAAVEYYGEFACFG